jgi:hypothetical protein
MVRAGQDLPVLLHLVAVEELGAQRRLLASEDRGEARSAGDRLAQREQRGPNGFLADPHASDSFLERL